MFYLYCMDGHKKWLKQTLNHKSKLRQCNICIVGQEELSRHTAQTHAATRELHHCLLCQRSFSSGTRHRLHMQGRRHRHLELTQRHTIHAVHRLLVGEDCPRIPSLSRTELQALQWRPTQPGYSHFYYQLTPLQMVLQVSFYIKWGVGLIKKVVVCIAALSLRSCRFKHWNVTFV